MAGRRSPYAAAAAAVGGGPTCYSLPVPRDRSSWPVTLAWFALFVVAALLNAGGYRYGGSDQAFYIPAIRHHLDPSLFPRDWSLMAPQDSLNLFTAVTAAVCRVTGLALPDLFLVLYFCGLALLAVAAWGLGRTLYRSGWTTVALLFALTLRHAVALGAVNTLEGYLHPRQLAFALGTLALVPFLRGWRTAAFGLVAASVAVHPTTGVWFLAWISVAIFVSEPSWRRPLIGLGAVGGLAAAWAIAMGPLAGRLTRMDATWMSALGSKTYLFVTAWPAWAWLQLLLYPLAIGWLYQLRRKRGLTSSRETGLVWGAGALVVVLLASLPFVAARIALAVQLQVPRVLWLLDLLATIYAAWWLSEAAPASSAERRARVVALALVVASLGRGIYVARVEHPERRLVQADFADSPWIDAMRWIAAHTPSSTFVLADPGHAWRYGTSVRVAGERDVFLEEAKDTAFALYSESGARRVLGRIARVPPAPWTLDAVETLSRDFGLDVLVSDQAFPLPVLHESLPFRIYRLR